MDLEPASSRVALITTMYGADKWLFARVCQFMSLQVALGDELLITFAALKGPLARVSTHVGLQVSRLGELFETLFKGTEEDFLFVFGSFDLLKLGCQGKRVMLTQALIEARAGLARVNATQLLEVALAQVVRLAVDDAQALGDLAKFFAAWVLVFLKKLGVFLIDF